MIKRVLHTAVNHISPFYARKLALYAILLVVLSGKKRIQAFGVKMHRTRALDVLIGVGLNPRLMNRTNSAVCRTIYIYGNQTMYTYSKLSTTGNVVPPRRNHCVSHPLVFHAKAGSTKVAHVLRIQYIIIIEVVFSF